MVWWIDNPRHDIQMAIDYTPIFNHRDRVEMAHVAYVLGEDCDDSADYLDNIIDRIIERRENASV